MRTCTPLLWCIYLTLWAAIANGQTRSPVVGVTERPVVAKQIAEGHWFFDFGKAAFGNLEIIAPPGVDEARVTVHLGEAKSGPTEVNQSPGGTVRHQRHDLTLSPGGVVRPSLTWAPPGWMRSGWLERPDNLPYEVMPFRYVEVHDAPRWFSGEHVRRVAWRVPFDDDAASFSSSDAQLNRVWDLCKYSIKATTFLGLYVDGDRERKPYEADALINQLAHYCVDQRYDTARLTHEYLLRRPTWPTEWRLQSVAIAWLDFLWSGEDAALREHYPTLKQRAMINRRTPDGLFRGFLSRGRRPGLEDIVDWPAGERDGYDMRMPVKTVVTAWHYHALVLLEKMAVHLEQPADATRMRTLARATHQAFNEQLWDDARGCYVDGLDPGSGEKSTHASAHANFFPLALGLVPPERVARVAAWLKSRGMTCSVYGAQFLLDALYQAGEAEYALRLLTADDRRSWRNMMDNVGTTITLEAWDPSLKPNLDWNHAWGAAPANVIPRGLMGIRPLAPGFTRFGVRPQLADLTEASVKLPTPQGAIRLVVRNPGDGPWEAEITVPPGTVAEFLPPPHTPGSLRVTPGQPAPLQLEQGATVIELPAGTHSVSVEKLRATD